MKKELKQYDINNLYKVLRKHDIEILKQNSLVHVRDEKVSLYRYFRDFSSHDSAIQCAFSLPIR